MVVKVIELPENFLRNLSVRKQTYLRTVEDAGPYDHIFKRTAKPQFEAFFNRLFTETETESPYAGGSVLVDAGQYSASISASLASASSARRRSAA